MGRLVQSEFKDKTQMYNLKFQASPPSQNTDHFSKSQVKSSTPKVLQSNDTFASRHIGPSNQEIEQMLKIIGFSNLDTLIEQTVPKQIRLHQSLKLPIAQNEYGALAQLQEIASKNQIFRSFIGMGYYDCFTPPVIQRNILENPVW